MSQGDLFAAPAQAHSATSKAAAESIRPAAATLRAAVLRLIRTYPGGLTDEEGIDLTGLSPSTYRPRRIENVRAGLIRNSGRTRKTRSGRDATVWEAVP